MGRIFPVVRFFFLYISSLLFGSFAVSWFVLRQRFFGEILPNYYAVNDTFYRGGRPSLPGIQELAEKGVKTIIHLCTGNIYLKRHRLQAYDQFNVIHIPFYPYWPTDEIAITFLQEVLNPKNGPTYVHCFHGVDRTGLMCAIYRVIVQGWPKEKAIEEMKKKGLHWWHSNMVRYIENMNVDFIRQSVLAYRSL